MDDEDVVIEPEESEQDLVISTDPRIVADYSTHARHALSSAEAAAATSPGGVVTCEHLLLSLVNDPGCAAAQVLAACGFSSESIAKTVSFIAGSPPAEPPAAAVVFSPRLERVLAGAGVEAGSREAAQIDTLHLLFALVRERKGIAALSLETPGVGHEMVGAALSNALRNGVTDPA